MAENSLIIALSAALLLAVGGLVFGVGRFIYGIAHYYFRERPAVRRIHHPAYGLLTGEGGLWSGVARPNHREVPFTVSGTDFAPDDLLLERVDSIMGRFADVEREAVEFLRVQEPEMGKAKLEVYMLEVEEKFDCFTVEFIAGGNDSVVWRVEFVAGKPTRTGFDD